MPNKLELIYHGVQITFDQLLQYNTNEIGWINQVVTIHLYNLKKFKFDCHFLDD